MGKEFLNAEKNKNKPTKSSTFSGKITSQISENLMSMNSDNSISDENTIDINKLGKFILDQVKDKIERKEIDYVGEGQEGIVYKVSVNMPNNTKKVFLAIKKRFDGLLEKEISLQNKFNAISKKVDSGVGVPDIFGGINSGDGDFILMEYINGKTLFTLKMEKIAEELYDKYSDKYPELKISKYLNKNINENDINKAHFFDFQTDINARKGLHDMISYLNDQNDSRFQNSIGAQTVVRLDKKTFDNAVEKLYNETKVSLFHQATGWDVQQKIKKFFIASHKEGLFHRDVGGNPTNIMFIQDGNNVKPIIIDFGKSKEFFGSGKDEYDKGDGPYGDEHESYLPDTYLCQTIRSLTEKPPRKEAREL